MLQLQQAVPGDPERRVERVPVGLPFEALEPWVRLRATPSAYGARGHKAPKIPPHGYRSCVEYLNKQTLVACGLTGVDYTIDNAKTWKLISKEGFHVCRISKFGSTVFLAGSNGKVGKLVFDGKKN